MKLTIVVSKADDMFIGSIKEIPGVLTQGYTVEETRENVMDALQLYLEAMQQEESPATTVSQEELTIA